MNPLPDVFAALSLIYSRVASHPWKNSQNRIGTVGAQPPRNFSDAGARTGSILVPTFSRSQHFSSALPEVGDPSCWSESNRQTSRGKDCGMAREYLRTLKAAILAVGLLVLLPGAAHAQSSFTGVVKDTSGAVLPGVTVEVASPVLIEKTRSVITDTSGGFRIVDLRPGTYTVTFSLEGFSTVRRDAVDLPANFVMTINTELRVGSLEETLTVTGAAPTVDVQTTTKSQVLNRDALDAIPTGRTIQAMGQLITGVTLNIP